MKGYNAFQIAMFGVQGGAVSVLCYLLGPGLAAQSGDPVLVSRMVLLIGVLSGGGGIAMLVIAFFRKK